MDYSRIFSEDVGSFFRSPVREIFKKVDLNSIYSFAGGYPSAETFPLEEIRRTMSEVIDKYGGKAFQYGATQGVPELREAVAARYGVPVERVQITSSSQQGIDVCTRVLVNPGDVVLTSNPSYLGALQSFCSYRADIRGVAHNDDLDAFRSSYEAEIAKVKEVQFGEKYCSALLNADGRIIRNEEMARDIMKMKTTTYYMYRMAILDTLQDLLKKGSVI